MDDPVPTWCKRMQDLPKDRVRRLRKGQNGDAVQNTGCLQLPEQKNKCSLPDMSPERNEAREMETQDAQRRALSRVSLHEMWSIPGLVKISADERGHVDICRTCELVPCAACTARLPRGNFTKSNLYRYFYSTGIKHITCLVCKEQQHARQQRLQNLMEKSSRAACWCKHPRAHTRKFPLHARYDGEIPYPGCDVMSRADSDWLMEQRKKNRYGRGT